MDQWLHQTNRSNKQMDNQNLEPLTQKDTLRSSRRGRLHASIEEIQAQFSKFSLEPTEGPSYAFRTADGIVITIYRRSDTAAGEWNVGGFDDTVIDKLKAILPEHKIQNNQEWQQELGLA